MPDAPDPLRWLPAGFFTAAFLIDYLDGYLARRSNTATALGEALDMEFDLLEVVIAMGLLVSYGKLSPAFLLAGLSSYLFAFVYTLAGGLGAAVYAIPPWIHAPFGRFMRQRFDRPMNASQSKQFRWPIGGFIRGYLMVILWLPCTSADTWISGLIFFAPYFIRNTWQWTALLGIADLRTPRAAWLADRASRLFFNWLPLPLRAALPLLLMAHLLEAPQQPARWLAIILGGCLALGAIGRYAAFGLMAVLILPTAGQLTRLGSEALAVCLILLITDTGLYSLWQPRGGLFGKRLG